MARRGRGLARYIDPTETSLEAAADFAARLAAPVLTDIYVDWGALRPVAVTPAIIPDLFAGDSLRLMGRFTGTRAATIHVRGLVGGRPVSFPVQVALTDAPSDPAGASAIPLVWARSQVSDLMRDYSSPLELRSSQLNEQALEARVTQLGLDYALVTDWTSFVAVSRRVVNANPGAARSVDVPLSMPAGVGPGAFGAPATGEVFGGASTPEPGILGLLALMLGLGLLALRHRRRQRAA
jgi:Ca-activated chloride channel homolog